MIQKPRVPAQTSEKKILCDRVALLLGASKEELKTGSEVGVVMPEVLGASESCEIHKDGPCDRVAAEAVPRL